MGSANPILNPSSASALLLILASHLLASFLSGNSFLPFL
jgi:hypothetical protein